MAALAIAAASLAVAPGAQAQEPDPDDVIIEAVYPTAIAGLEDLVFDVTRGSASDEDLLVQVTLSPGVLSAVEQRLPVLIGAGSTTTRLLVSTRLVMEGATTGDVTATVVDGDDHDVGEPSTATVRLHVGGGGTVTVGFSAPVYRLDESVGTTTDQVRLTARTSPGAPVPRSLTVPVWTRADTAISVDDYSGLSGTITFPQPWTVEETLDGDVYSSEASVPVSIVDDDASEGDERFTLWVGFPTESLWVGFPTESLWVGFPTESPFAVSLGSTDSAPECDSDGCGSYVIITDNEGGGTIILDEDSGNVTISAVHSTALEEIDNLVFTVARTTATDSELEVPVTLSPGIIDEDRLSHTVTIPANETSAELTVHTRALAPAAATGDVTATVGDGDLHDVGDPSTATVRVYVAETLVTVRFDAASYMLDEDVGATGDEIRLIARTVSGVPAPNFNLRVSVSARAAAATSPDDYTALSVMLAVPGTSERTWTADRDAFVTEVSVPLTIVDDDEVEGDERLMLILEQAPGFQEVVAFLPADVTAPPCAGGSCEATVTIVDNDNRSVDVSQTSLTIEEGSTKAYMVVLGREPTGDVTVTPEVTDASDAEVSVSEALVFTPQDWDMPQTVTVTAAADNNRANGSATINHTVTGADYEANGVTAPPVTITEWDAEGRTVVTLVHVPDGTVIPADSTVGVGATVVDGATFSEDERVYFRLLFESADGGRAQYGADVELRFEWTHHSPIVPISGQVSLIELSLYRVDVWDSAVQILDNDVGNPDGTMTARITGCKRNGCIIGTPSEITVTILDDDGGPAAAPPGPPDPPRLVCATAGGRYDPTGVAVSWSPPSFVGGAPVEGYDVQYQGRTDDGNPWVWGDWQEWLHTGTATSTTITGLDADAPYGVRVRAVNANGPGQWSLPGTFWTGYSQDLCEILDELTPGS